VRECLVSGGDRRTGPSAAAGGDVTGGASSVRHRPVTARNGESRFMLSYDGPLELRIFNPVNRLLFFVLVVGGLEESEQEARLS